jgi:hypothetical protein
MARSRDAAACACCGPRLQVDVVRGFLAAAGGMRTHTTADSFATSIPAATS